MKLHSLTIKNFRALRDVCVCPAETGITVIEGRNEAGKSSLGEALQMLLDVKDRSKAQQVRNVSPAESGAGPEISAEISSGPYRFSYHKRFLSKPQTTLQIDAPNPASLHGDEAHERVLAMLSETMDAELWAALRMEQGGSHALADLTRQSALSNALDQAAAGTSGDGTDEDLFSRVEAVFFDFYTRRPGHPEGKALKDLRSEVTRLEQSVAELDNEQRLLDDQVNQARTLSRELAERQQSLSALRTEQARLQQQLETAQALHQSVERKLSEVAITSAQRDTARLALDGRADLVKRLDQQTRELHSLRQQDEGAQPALEQARKAAQACAASLAGARQRRDAAAEQERAVLARQARLSEAREIADLRRKQEQWRGIAERLRESRLFLAACKVTPQSLRDARDADARYRQLVDRARAQAPELLVAALGSLQLEEGGQVTELAAGDTVRTTLSNSETLTIRNVATLTMTAGEDQAARNQAIAAAKRELDAALEGLGASSTAQAEQQLEERARYEERLKSLEEQSVSVLGGVSAQELEARIDALAPAAASAGDGTAPDGADSERLAEHVKAARDERESAERAMRQEEQALSAKSALKETLERSHLQRALQTEAISEAIAALSAQLDKDRHATSDESLASHLAELTKDLERKESALKQARVEAAQLPLEQARAGAQTAQRVLSDAVKSLNEGQTRLAELRSALTVREEKGLYEASAKACAALTVARAELDNNERQANAARLLYETLSQARQRQRSRYLLPLASKMDELGRVVFGDSFRVTLDDTLAIASRTLNGTTVPFGSLSVGAREQMSVLQRVATALCVSEDDGVPLILDDVLGHADPERLRAMNAVLGLAGKRTQVIVTTCYPDRYRHIDRALTVTLP